MLGAIKYNLSNLTNFAGRDARQTFWFYVLFLVILQYAAGMLVTMPMMGSVMQDAFNGAREGISEAELQARMMQTMAGPLRTSMLVSAGVSLVCALLLVASFVRRLHDSGRPGWIAAIAFLLVLGAQAATISRMDVVLEAMTHIDATNPMGALEAQRPLLMASALSWVGYLIVIVFGVWPSTPGPNRYGDDPTRF